MRGLIGPQPDDDSRSTEPRTAYFDPHVHVDRFTGVWPNNAVKKLTGVDIDGVVLLAHNKIEPDILHEISDRVMDAATKMRQRFTILFGVEVDVVFNGLPFHIVCAFENAPNPFELPEIPKKTMREYDFERFIGQHSTVAIAAHPTVMEGEERSDLGALFALRESGLVQGEEVINGRSIINGIPIGATKTALTFALNSHAKLAPVGASDARYARQIGSVTTRFRRGSGDGDGFFDAIRHARTTPSVDDPYIRNAINADHECCVMETRICQRWI